VFTTRAERSYLRRTDTGAISTHRDGHNTVLQSSCQRMTSRTDKMSAGNSRAAYMREYRKRKRLQENNCNNVPKRTKLHAERQREYRETHKNLSAEYMHFQC
jgi:hypothetical protein